MSNLRLLRLLLLCLAVKLDLIDVNDQGLEMQELQQG
eukprot:CAMPEP_0181528586 /NCGR_PEP_ID=MMETSP1110-20121109/70613_1 /TAXON_ID=174948 /ORGANISM="Symbiodinium sp., Strain CCMP421" /LENGTH=36 /DNA_ID= /DNA_START= /DNA_END= /DNA_ORIENTATION=